MTSIGLLLPVFLLERPSSKSLYAGYYRLYSLIRSEMMSFNHQSWGSKPRNIVNKVTVETKQPQAIALADLICPITCELPVDPVIAEDGRIYERKAIQKQFSMQQNLTRYPWSKKIIGEHLIPAPQHEKCIETLVENGTITDRDLLDKWYQNRQEKERMDAILKGAERGDFAKLHVAITGFTNGSWGFEQNLEEAYRWMKIGHSFGFANMTALMGLSLARGTGTEQNEGKGLMYLTEAAAKGSQTAAFWLGQAHARGSFGLPVDQDEARRWFKKARLVDSQKVSLSNVVPSTVNF